MWNKCGIAHRLPVMHWPFASKSIPHGLLVPSGKALENVFRRVIAPDTGVDVQALIVRRAGFTRLRMARIRGRHP